MGSEKRRHQAGPARVHAGVLAISALAVALMAAVAPQAALAAIPNPLVRPITPNPASAITIRPSSNTVYKVDDCIGCHDAQTVQADNNHGIALRPVETTIGATSDNPYFGTFPGGSFTLGQVNWAVGGLAIGQELYLFNGSGTYGGNPFTFPQVGDKQWYMDYPWPTQLDVHGQLDFSANLTPGRPMIDPATAALYNAWWPWNDVAGANFFTGSSNPTVGPANVGCSSCHAYNATVTVTTIPTYALDEWGVTCANCHAQTVAVGGTRSQRQSTAHAGPYWDGAVCLNCHQKTPTPAVAGETTGRSQQIAMGVWDTGQARDKYNQGYEANKAKSSVPTITPGQVETTSGAGHPQSWNAVKTIFGGTVPEGGRFCARCHSTQGYIARTSNGTDIPYWFEAPTAFGGLKRYDVDLATNVGNGCNACHTSHAGERGLNQFSQRAADKFEVCADCHRNQNLSMVEATSTAAKIPYTDPSVLHPTREMYMGYGGYGVDNMPPAHLTVPLSDTEVGVMCQYCHMPSTIPSGLTFAPPESSHLFRAIMPSKSLTSASVGWNLFPAGVTSTTPVPQAGSPLPDDSCSGAMCHPQTDATKTWLQDIITTRQTAIVNKLAQVEALRVQAAVVASNTPLYQKARTNLLMVRNDGSYGIHNYYYANSLLDWSICAFDSIIGSPVIPGNVPVSRWDGPTRYETAASISANSYPASLTANAVIVTGQNYPDALSASALAGSVGGPILLSQTSSLPAATAAELNRLGVHHVWIVGGTGVVTPAVATQLQTIVGGGGTVVRVSGPTRYATSAAVAQLVSTREGAGFNHEVFLATGQNYPDALACAPYAYSRKAPVLLTQTASLPASTTAALSGLGITKVTVAGGTGAVSAAVFTATEAITGPGSATRIAGQDRYNTAVLMTDYATASGWATRAFVGIASGQNYPDALTGGPAVGRRNGVLLLTRSNALPAPVALWLHNAQAPPPDVAAAAIFGGSGAVTDSVWANVYTLLNP